MYNFLLYQILINKNINYFITKKFLNFYLFVHFSVKFLIKIYKIIYIYFIFKIYKYIYLKYIIKYKKLYI